MKTAVIILVIINLFIFFFVQHKEKKYEELLQKSYFRIIETEYSFEQLHNQYFNSFIYSGLKVEEQLNRMMKKKMPGLYIRIPELACSTCMDSLFIHIAKQYSNNDLENVIVLVSHSNQYYFSQLKRLQGYYFPNIIETKPSQEFMKLDKFKIPYLFFVNKNFETVNVFMVDKDKSDDIKKYLSIMKQKYFN